MSKDFEDFLEWKKNKPEHNMTIDEVIKALKETDGVKEIFAQAEAKKQKIEERKKAKADLKARRDASKKWMRDELPRLKAEFAILEKNMKEAKKAYEEIQKKCEGMRWELNSLTQKHQMTLENYQNDVKYGSTYDPILKPVMNGIDTLDEWYRNQPDKHRILSQINHPAELEPDGRGWIESKSNKAELQEWEGRWKAYKQEVFRLKEEAETPKEKANEAYKKFLSLKSEIERITSTGMRPGSTPGYSGADPQEYAKSEGVMVGGKPATPKEL